jgi:hypothetical protein
VAQVPNGELRALEDSARVYVDLHNAKIFSPGNSVRSDELAAS